MPQILFSDRPPRAGKQENHAMPQNSDLQGPRIREAADSIDFYVRHGRALHAQAMREGLEKLRSWLRSWMQPDPRQARRTPWATVWPVERLR
jgi:hypothetical protein